MIRKTAAVLAVCLLVAASLRTARADFIYSGRAYGAFSPGVVDPPIADTGQLSGGGGLLTAHLDNFSFMGGIVTSGALDAQTMGTGGVASSTASIASFHADLGALGINFVANADLIQSQSKADGTAMPLAVSGSAMFTNLVVNNMAINSQAPPNTMVDLGAVGFMVLNEETSMVTPTGGEISVTALHVHLSALGVDIFLAHTESDITPQQAAIPEPPTWILLGIGGLAASGFAVGRRLVRFCKPPRD
jgi:hypothetical protein